MKELTGTYAYAIHRSAGHRTMAMNLLLALLLASLTAMPAAAQNPASGPDPAQKTPGPVDGRVW